MLTLEIDKILREVKATQKMEGLEVSKETEELIRDCLLGKISFDEAREKVFQKIKLEEATNQVEDLIEEIEK